MGAVFSGASAIYNHNSLQHKATDYYIAFRTQHALNNDKTISQQSNISVTSFNRLVLLTGQAETITIRQRAGQVASQTPNVIRIYNAISIGSPLSAATIAEDTWITTKVKSKLIASNHIDPNKIKVVTENHIVYLMGIVPQDQADIAVTLARNTSGVTHVVKIFYYVIMPKIE